MSLMIRFISFALICLFAASCSPARKTGGRYAPSNKIYAAKTDSVAGVIKKIPTVDSIFADSLKVPADWAGTPNLGLRKPNIVVIHHTAQDSCGQTLNTFTQERTQVSAHYVICRDGTLHHILNDYLRAFHAGVGRWGWSTDLNSSSIGIEIDNNGTEDFSAAQINTLLGLLKTLKGAYNIPTYNFVGHSDIAPGRKVDPQVKFPWKMLADSGYGIWYDTVNLQVPAAFDPQSALRMIGYDLSNVAAATEAFRRHFMGYERKGLVSKEEEKVLFALMKKEEAL